MSNFTYCPLVWHFCGKLNNSKIEKIQERALRVVCNDLKSEYTDLLEKMNTSTMLQSRLNCILVEVYKSLVTDPTNPPYVRDLVKIKESPYDMRDCTLLNQPRKRTTNFGLRSYSYLATKLWNDLPSHLKCISDNNVIEFKCRLKNYNGTKLDSMSTFYV